MKKLLSTIRLTTLAAGLVLAVFSTAQAATATVDPSTHDEIIVTAEKRSESVQNVPLSITTIGAAALEQNAIRSFFDYGTKVPT